MRKDVKMVIEIYSRKQEELLKHLGETEMKELFTLRKFVADNIEIELVEKKNKMTAKSEFQGVKQKITLKFPKHYSWKWDWYVLGKKAVDLIEKVISNTAEELLISHNK